MGRAELLAEYSGLLNRYGPDSDECEQFERDHEDDEELVGLMLTAYWLKKAFLAGLMNQ